jgi:FtsH-binding integral membrane protein
LGFLLGFGATFWIDELSYLFGLHIAFIFIFFLDIILSPLKAYYDEGLLIKDVSIILRKYAKV